MSFAAEIIKKAGDCKKKDSLTVKALTCCSAESICSLGSTTELLEMLGKLFKSLTTSTQLCWKPE